MATDNLVRALSFALLVSLSASVSSAQEQPRLVESAKDATVSPLPDTNVQALAESPVSPPIVVCNGQQLTITANNSTLGSVLAAVRKCTGAQIDIPEDISASRLFDHLGPGPARQVLTALLGETGYDFVIGSSDQSPEKVESILLMERAKDTSETAVADRNLTPTRRAYLQMIQNAKPRSATPEENTQETEGASDARTTEQPAVAPAESTTNANQTPASDSSSVAAAGAVQPSAPSSTPPAAEPNPASPQSDPTEDQITSMQQLFEQRQKMMQNQNQSQNPPQPQ